MDEKIANLRRLLSEMGQVLVAFSGGVDSSFLLCVAADVLGERTVALTTLSPTSADDDSALALSLARDLGVRHVVIHNDELEIPGYAENPSNRCYFCKQSLYQICADEARKLGIAHIVDGVNADDLGDYRPGLQAAGESSIRHPLVECGLSKTEIRALSRGLGLPTWDKPSSPCLSSRFPYGTRITLEALRRVGAAERVLHRLGFRECRVRFHETVARIEVPASDLPRLMEPETRATAVRDLKTLGFLYVTVDLQGYRTGSLNEALATRRETPSPNGRE